MTSLANGEDGELYWMPIHREGIMRYFILGVVTFWAIVMVSEPALANCTTNTIYGPDGGMRTCTTCCYMGGNCTTQCF